MSEQVEGKTNVDQGDGRHSASVVLGQFQPDIPASDDQFIRRSHQNQELPDGIAVPFYAKRDR